MLKFQDIQGCEIFINDDGCIVIKQQSIEFGKEVAVVLTPIMAYELARLIDEQYEGMAWEWADGMVKK
jgi:hypothetical protein